MINESAINAKDRDAGYQNMTALENERKKLREETLTWISHYGLSRVRLAWRGHSNISTFADSAA